MTLPGFSTSTASAVVIVAGLAVALVLVSLGLDSSSPFSRWLRHTGDSIHSALFYTFLVLALPLYVLASLRETPMPTKAKPSDRRTDRS